LPSDLAVPTGMLVRLGIVVAALVLAAPLVTGAQEGSLARAGVVALVSLGLACTPILASAAVGIAVVYGRRVRVGEVAEVGGRTGKVREVSLLEVRLEDDDGCDVRVPHLLGLVHPTRVIGRAPLHAVEVVVSAEADLVKTREILLSTAEGLGTRATVTLLAFDADGASFRATIRSDRRTARDEWLGKIAEALGAAGISLGRAPRRDAP
jgi:small-conductance mechanosensitive channel